MIHIFFSDTLTRDAVDGDIIRCDDGRIRLTDTDAPEIGVFGDAKASRKSLKQVLRRQPLTIERIGSDRYVRTLALVSALGAEMQCWEGSARRTRSMEQWGNGRRLDPDEDGTACYG